jgi:hypothetical protein
MGDVQNPSNPEKTRSISGNSIYGGKTGIVRNGHYSEADCILGIL